MGLTRKLFKVHLYTCTSTLVGLQAMLWHCVMSTVEQCNMPISTRATTTHALQPGAQMISARCERMEQH
jgi:hypothetical protein